MRGSFTIFSKQTCWGPGPARWNRVQSSPVDARRGRIFLQWELVLNEMLNRTRSSGRIVSIHEDRRGATTSHSPILTERRSNSRYPLDLRVSFRLISRASPLSGAGRTVNLSAAGLLVATPGVVSCDEFSAGARLEINIEWPVLLDGRIPLQLFAIGLVVRRGAANFAVTFQHHQFRTMAKLKTDASPVSKHGYLAARTTTAHFDCD